MLSTPHGRTARLTLALLLAELALWGACVRAADATFMGAELTRDEPGERPGIFLAAHYEFDLPAPLIDVLHRGIALYFAHEFRLSEPRWYWLPKTRVDERFLIRLAFDPLTRRYRVGYNGLSLNFDSLEQALPYVKNIRRWRVAPARALSAKETYEAEVRFFLDATKLPKPMQVTTEDSVDWTVESEWTSIKIDPALLDTPEGE